MKNNNKIMASGFYKVPKIFYLDKEHFEALSVEASLLYAMLLDRQSASQRNGWVDECGRVYQYFTVEQAAWLLNCGHEKACKLFNELQTARLIERKRQGIGKPSIIYVKDYFDEILLSKLREIRKK